MGGGPRLAAGLLLSLCILQVQTKGQVEAGFKFMVLTPNVLYVNETTDIFIVKHPSIRELQTKVQLTLGPLQNKSTDQYIRRAPKRVAVRVEEWMLGQPDAEGRWYVRLSVQCTPHAFSRHMDLLVSRRTGIVYLQTDKPIYTPKQTVNVRVFTLNKQRVSSEVAVRLDIINPDGAILQREELHTSMGLVNTTFHISDLPVLGEWSVIAYYGHNYSQKKKVAFTVEKYVLPHFEVRLLDVTDFILSSTDKVSGKVKARYSFAGDVRGHAYVTLWVVRKDTSVPSTQPPKYTSLRVTEPTKYTLRNGEAVFSEAVSNITHFLSSSVEQLAREGARLHVEADVTEDSGQTEGAVYTHCVFSTSPYTISTAGVPWSVNPGLPFDFSIAISYPSGRVAPDTDVRANIGGHPVTKRTNEHGVAYFTFDVGLKVQHDVPLEVEVLDQQLTTLSRKGWSVPINHMTEQIKVVQEDRTQEADATGVRPTRLRVRIVRNKKVRRVYLTLMSGNRILEVTGQRVDGRPELTFTPRTNLFRMVPEVRALVWYVGQDGQVIAHSTQLTVSRICQFETRISPDPLKRDGYLLKDNIQLKIEGPMMSQVALLAVDTSVYFLNNKDRLSRDKVFDGFMDEDIGCGAGGGTTADQVFVLSGLAALTDANISTTPRTSETCASASPHRERRAVGDPAAASCATVHCCAEGTSFGAAVDLSLDVNIDATCRRRMMTASSCSIRCQQQLFSCCTEELVNRTLNLPTSGKSDSIDAVPTKYSPAIKTYSGSVKVRSDFPESFLLKTINMGESNSRWEAVQLPDSVTTWSLQAVSVSAADGLCVSPPRELLVKKRLFMKLHLPYQAVLGEQLELRATVYNTITESDTAIRTVVNLTHTDDLCYQREKDVPHVLINPGESFTYTWTVVPRKVGQIPLQLTMRSVCCTDAVRRVLNVVPPGVQEAPRPVCLTLNPQQPLSYSGSDHSVNYTVSTKPAEKKQTFVLNLEAPTDAVDGAHQLVLGLEGGVMAEVVGAYLQGRDLYEGAAGGSGEQTMARLGASISAARYVLHTTHGAMSDNTTDTINQGIQRMMGFRLKSGAFGMYQKEIGGTHPSLWLTAFTTRMFSVARELSAQVREDPSDVICSAARWLMGQNKQNLFHDARGLPHLWDLKGRDVELALTSFVVLAVKESACVQPNSNEEVRIGQVLDNLANQVSSVTRPYTLAIMTYALAKTGHSRARTAYQRLQTLATRVNGKIPAQMHWRLSPSRTTQEDVETTAYGVLTQLTLGDVSRSHPYVRWLLTQRRADGLFKTTQTTVVGLQALTEYSIHTPTHHLNLTCSIRSRTTTHTCHISNQAAKRQINVAGAVGGRLEVECEGEGIGQLTLHSSYYKDKVNPGAERGFRITALQEKKMTTTFSGVAKHVANHDVITVCTRMKKSLDSCGHAVVDVGLGTGYEATSHSLKQKSERRSLSPKALLPESLALPGFQVLDDHPGAVDMYTASGRSVRFYVPQVNRTELCIKFTVKCHHKVDNMQPVAVSVYDYYEPDQFKDVIFYHPKTKAENLHSNQKCVSNACPACHGYDTGDVAPLVEKELKERASLNDYVFKGKLIAINHEENTIVFQIKKVGKNGSEDAKTLVRANVKFRLSAGCSPCNNLRAKGKYLIMGKEQHPTQSGSRLQYVLDDQSYIAQLDAKKPLDAKRSDAWCHQKRFCAKLNMCNLDTNPQRKLRSLNRRRGRAVVSQCL